MWIEPKTKLELSTMAAILQMEMGNKHQETLELFLTNTGDHNILLGTDWLKEHNPTIDWKNHILSLN